MQPLKARALSSKQIEKEVDKCGPSTRKEYDEWKFKLGTMMDNATDESGESLAGFLFAVAQLGNEITARHNIKR